MRNLSVWAKLNPWTARITIVLSYFILNALGFFIGKALLDGQIEIPDIFIYSSCFFFIILFSSYPKKKNKENYKNYYLTQKTFDLFLVATSFILVICYSNKQKQLPSPFHISHALAVEPSSVSPEKKPSQIEKKRKSFSKEMKKNLKEMVQKIKKEYKDLTKGEKAALIVLSVLVAIALFFLVAAISCNLACAGSDGAAVWVLLLGSAAIIFFLVRTIRRISRGKPKPKEQTTENTSSSL